MKELVALTSKKKFEISQKNGYEYENVSHYANSCT